MIGEDASMGTLIQDLRYGLRVLARNPSFATVAVLTLALGIGANTAVFSAIYAVLLRPLPFKDAARLVLITEYSPGNVAKTGSPLLRYRARAAENTVFEETAAYWDVSGGNGLVFGYNGSPERLQFSIVTNSFFSILGVHPELGRTFSAGEEGPGGAKVFLASDGLWHRLLGGDPHAIGKSFRLDGELYTLAGVLPSDFHFPRACELWLPVGTLGAQPLHDRISHEFWMLGRLRRGFGPAQAQADMDAIQQRQARSYPATDANWQVRVSPLLEELVGNVRLSLWVLFGAVGFVLLIACTNVINLLLARAIEREKEFAVRAALGAARPRLLRQALTETLLIVCAGTALSLVLSKAILAAIFTLSSGSIPRFEQPHLNAAVLSFSAGLALLTTLLVGVAPGLHACGSSLADAFQEGQRIGFVSRRSTEVRNVLVASEVAITLLLLSGAGLTLRSFMRLREVDPGFRPEHLITVKIALPDALYPRTEQRTAFLRQVLEALNSTPGIDTAAATDRLPLSGETNWGGINIAGRPVLDSAHAPAVEGRGVSANYFRALGIPLLRGREFTDQEGAAVRHVAVINQAMANQFWPGGDPIGQRIVSAPHPSEWSEIMGVVGNVKDFALDAESPPEMYTPYRWWNTMSLVVHGSGDIGNLFSEVRKQVAMLDKGVPVYGASRMDELVTRSTARQRFDLLLLALFAFTALVLAAVGVYGVLAFTVNRRIHELGIRMALGAQRRDVLRLVIGQGLKLVAIGTLAGLIAALAMTRLMSSLLYGISATDPLTLAGVAILLAVVALGACYLPARRATKVDPMVALRYE
jgi:putative ABC transport system permease protein